MTRHVEEERISRARTQIATLVLHLVRILRLSPGYQGMLQRTGLIPLPSSPFFSSPLPLVLRDRVGLNRADRSAGHKCEVRVLSRNGLINFLVNPTVIGPATKEGTSGQRSAAI
jgi:hypothetical protein